MLSMGLYTTLEVGRKSDRALVGPISAYCHPERSEQRERSRRISDSFAPAKPVPVLGVDLPGWILAEKEADMASSASQESPSLSHFLEQAHAIGQQAERTAAEAERNRHADDSVVHSLIDSGLLKILQPR